MFVEDNPIRESFSRFKFSGSNYMTKGEDPIIRE